MKTRTLPKKTVLRLFSLVRPHLGLFIAAMLALALGAGVNLLFPEIIRRALNSPTLSFITEHPTLFALQLIALFAFQGVCFYCRIYFFGIIGQKVVNSLRSKLFKALIAQDIQFFDSSRTGDLVSRLTADTALMQDAVSVKLSVLIRYSFQVLIGTALMAYMSFHLTLTILLSLSVLIVLSIFLGKKLKTYSKLQQQELGRATTIAEESFSGIRTVKAFNKEGYVEALFQNSIDRSFGIGLSRNAISAFFQSFVNFLMNGCLVIVLLYGIYLASNEAMTFGDLTSFLLYGVIVAVSFAFAISCYSELLQALGGADRVFEFLDSQPPAVADGIELKVPAHGAIAFERVSFAYPSRTMIPVLKEISFTIPQGQTTALVGPSGSGKSTLINLILKFYRPSSGAIRFDGADIQTVSTSSLRETIAYVPQDTRLFGLTIGENLRFGKADATSEELVEACRKANLLEFINGLPQRFDTPLGDSGVQISGGQKQRLAIARAILKNPSFLILDEATSSLDGENEAAVQDALTTLMKGRTCLIIAHRLSSIKHAQNILVVEHGTIVQDGTYDTLSNQPGAFRDIIKFQELGNRTH